MSQIKAKIIGKQVWMAENLTASQFRKITGSPLQLNNGIWTNSISTCCSYEVNLPTKKKNYLFNQEAALAISPHNRHNRWRLPTRRDLSALFNHILPGSDMDRPYGELAELLRGNYGWFKNGTNKVGFNAFPNPRRNDSAELREGDFASWWFYDDKTNSLQGLSVYNDLDVIAECIPSQLSGFAIRLVMDLEENRIEDGIEYV